MTSRHPDSRLNPDNLANPDPSTLVPTPHPQPQPAAPPRLPAPPHRSVWFWLPLMAQAALILLVPVQSALTYATGETVVLQTVPVDPYDVFRGYYVTLSYDISTSQRLEQVPGWQDTRLSLEADSSRRSLFSDDRTLYVVLEAPAAGVASTTPPTPWTPVAVSRDRPTQLESNQVALRGRYESWGIIYDLERYYMPEDRRDEINTKISEIQQVNPIEPNPDPTIPDGSGNATRPFVVEVKVGGVGQGVPLGFWLRDEYIQF